MLNPEHIRLFTALVRLMRPLVEIVVHDLHTGVICFVDGGLSQRAKGDPSLLSIEDLESDLDQVVYPKLNFDGRLIKSISVPLGLRWLACINCDVSVFNQMQSLSQFFLAQNQPCRPESLFKNDWQDRLHVAIHGFLDQRGWGFAKLSPSQKRQVVRHIYELGAFNEKNAADYVAKTLSMGRATVFNCLRQWRKG